MQIGQPIIVSDVIAVLDGVSGVVSVYELSFSNVFGRRRNLSYSDDRFNISTNLRDGMLICPSEAIFQVKYPQPRHRRERSMIFRIYPTKDTFITNDFRAPNYTRLTGSNLAPVRGARRLQARGHLRGHRKLIGSSEPRAHPAAVRFLGVLLSHCDRVTSPPRASPSRLRMNHKTSGCTQSDELRPDREPGVILMGRGPRPGRE
jgi:hypothetical protein